MKKSIKVLLITAIAISTASVLSPVLSETKTYKLEAKQTLASVGREKILVRDWSFEFNKLPPKVRQKGQSELFIPIREVLVKRFAVAALAKDEGMARSEGYRVAIKNARIEILANLYLQKNLSQKVSEQDLKDEYQKYKAEVSKQSEIKVSHILLKNRSEADKVIKALGRGKKFSSLAKSKSIGPSAKKGGSLGYIAPGNMVPEFEQAAFALRNNSYTKKPVKTKFGWHVIKREGSRSRRVEPFDKVKQFLGSIIQRRKLEAITKKALAKTKVVFYDQEGKEIKN